MPDVDSTGKDAVAGPRDPPVLHPHTHEPRILVARPLRLERLAADERPAPLDDPGAVHLERRLMPVEVLSGEEVAFLEAERVPRPEADRLDSEVPAGLEERFPDPRSLRRRRKELETRFSRVPGPRDEKRGPSSGNGGVPCGRDGGARRIRVPPPLDFRWNRARSGAPWRGGHEVDRHAGERLDSTQIDRRETLEEFGRPRTLERQAEPFRRSVREHDVRGCVRLEPRPHRVAWTRIAHEQKTVRSEARDDHIVQDRPVFAKEMGVAGLAGRRRHIVRTQVIKESVRRRTLDEDLTHMTDVKKADGLADREMFVDDAGILEGHLPSAELDEARARGAMPVEERSARRHARRQRARR